MWGAIIWNTNVIIWFSEWRRNVSISCYIQQRSWSLSDFISACYLVSQRSYCLYILRVHNSYNNSYLFLLSFFRLKISHWYFLVSHGVTELDMTEWLSIAYIIYDNKSFPFLISSKHEFLLFLILSCQVKCNIFVSNLKEFFTFF